MWAKFLRNDTGTLGNIGDVEFILYTKGWAIDPAKRLNFIASISEKDNSSTKKHINNDIKSAKVASQAGKPAGQSHLSSSSFTVLVL